MAAQQKNNATPDNSISTWCNVSRGDLLWKFKQTFPNYFSKVIRIKTKKKNKPQQKPNRSGNQNNEATTLFKLSTAYPQ